MTSFYEKLDEYFGDELDLTDIRAVVRRCWFYDFAGYPVRVWQGRGKLTTEDGQQWLGTLDSKGNDVHKVPRISDGRDGSSATLTFSLNLADFPNEVARATYDAIKDEQWRAKNRKITCYLALFNIDEKEGLRPKTPIVFFRELIMMAPRFSEKVDQRSDGAFIKHYICNVTAKDNNFGRSETPNGTYADAIQKERARQLGVSIDRGSEFLAKLSNRTYQLP